MARAHIATALASAILFLVFTSHLILTWRRPVFDGSTSQTYSSKEHNSQYDYQHALNSEDGAGVANVAGTEYLLGVGKADITGPVVEINMMGYADPNQVGSGLRQRLYSRAFIVGDVSKPEDRFVYIVLDTQSGDTAVRYGILDALASLGNEYGVYSQKNVAIIGTHSHSGPGAWLNYLLPQITSKGFDMQSYQAIVDGAVLSIRRAHEGLRPGYLSFGSAVVKDANINRSLYAYLANPAKERAKYADDVDKELTLLRFKDARSRKDMGILTWFPVHGTSMLGNNTLISGDNKGVAATMFEKSVQGQESVTSDFVAGFSQANVGDTSPNVLGAYCEDTGEKCSFNASLCGGKTGPCHGRGPLFREDDRGASSCFEIGRRQFVGAKGLFDSLDDAGTPISGTSVKSFHSFKDLSSYTFPHPNGSIVSTCPAALGYSFAAGTTDGPGAFDFKQNNPGAPNANPFWTVVRSGLKEPSEEQKACHAPKPILLDVGEISNPYQWTPNIVDVQLLRVGQLIIIVSPGEATTMSGRRWRDAIASTAKSSSLTGDDEPIVVLGGPANSYTHYIATEEEYGIQRYEGASTLYGPHTLNAHINLSTSYLPYLADDSSAQPSSGPYPPNNVNVSLSFITGVIYDRAPFFKSFGDVLQDVNKRYLAGQPVSVTFVGANPRNNLRLEDTYVAVEQKAPDGTWRRVRDDSDWSVIFRWKRTSTVLATSEVEITWETEKDTEVGLDLYYRIRYFGASKAVLGGGISEFEGVSGEFRVF
ncbi:MAG: hypothetical protein OHK93_000634 [Ramalina farinacea]|uniref:Neutral ceramidase n=1 Tax=Ramalina farinacea TaxID=258253 RepID=A0AA43QFA0_9LECA|nr:hypothetical protein [Ramalina farinacea]